MCVTLTPPHTLTPLPADTPILVALSGGADSVALLHLLAAYGREHRAPLYAAHVNHRIRGEEAERDRDFCQALTKELNIPLFVLEKDVPAYAKERATSLENAAREVRYAYFSSLMKEHKIPLLATAHNADDNLETMLLHLTRGSGLQGLAGTPPVRPVEGGYVIRPLLSHTKRDILRYCEKHGLSYVTDATNTDLTYARNRIRHTVLPALRALNPRVEESARRTSRILREDMDFWEGEITRYLSDYQPEIGMDTAIINACHKALASRLIVRMYAWQADGAMLEDTHVEAILRLARTSTEQTSLSLPGRVQARIRTQKLVFEKTTTPDAPPIDYTIPLSEGCFTLPHMTLTVTKHSADDTSIVEKAKNVHKKSLNIFISSATIEGNLHIRPRRAGDTIRMGHMTRKVKKLMCDAHLPVELRNRLPLVCDERQILWIPLIGGCDAVKCVTAPCDVWHITLQFD